MSADNSELTIDSLRRMLSYLPAERVLNLAAWLIELSFTNYAAARRSDEPGAAVVIINSTDPLFLSVMAEAEREARKSGWTP